MASIRDVYLQVGLDVKDVQSKLDKLDKDFSKFNEKQNSAFGKLGKTIRNAFIGAGAIAVGRELMEIEQLMIAAKFAINGLDDPKNFKTFEENLSQLGKEVPKSKKELLEMAINAGKSGIAFKDIGESIKLSTMSAVAWDGEAGAVSETLSKQRAILGFNGQKMQEYAAMVSLLADNGAILETQLVDTNTRILGQGKQAKLTANEVSALSASMINLGVGPERASTALMNLFTVIREQARAGEGGIDTMKRLFGEIGKITDSKRRLSVMQKLFGASLEAANIEKLMDYVNGIEDGTNKGTDFIKVARTMQKEADKIFKDQYQQRLKATASQLQLLKNRFFEIAYNVGNVVLPVLNNLMQIISNVTDVILSMPSELVWIGATAAGIIFLLPKLKKFIAFMREILTLQKMMIALDIVKAAITNPMKVAKGLAIAGTAIVGGLALDHFLSKDTGNEGGIGGNMLPQNPAQSDIMKGIASNVSNQNSNVNNNVNITQNINGTSDPVKTGQTSADSFERMLGFMLGFTL